MSPNLNQPRCHWHHGRQSRRFGGGNWLSRQSLQLAPDKGQLSLHEGESSDNLLFF